MQKTNSFYYSLYLGLLVSFSLILSSCGSQKEVDKVGDAQQCLNQATATTAMDCVSKVDGLTSGGAYNIRCAAAFVREGFANPTKYTTAFDALKNSGSGTSSFMGLVSFSSTGNITTDATNAGTTFSDCYNAGAKGKSLIASFGYITTALMKFFAESSNNSISACTTPSTTTGYDITSCMNAITASGNATYITNVATIGSTSAADSSGAGQVQSSIGTVIISTYTISCSGKGANQDLCDKLKTSINSGGGASNPRGVARKFLVGNVPGIAEI